MPRRKTYNVDVIKVGEAITERTKVMMLVHLHGQPAEMDPICESARKHNLKVVDDNARARGAMYKVKRTGSLGDVARVSFYPSKKPGAYSDSGAISTPCGTRPAYHLFAICHQQRDALQAHLNQNGIGTLIHYPIPLYLQQACADLKIDAGAFAVTKSLTREMLSLPISGGARWNNKASRVCFVRSSADTV
jgi:dTDP-4-amino-4,6-dideoxygalactose transaminase